MSLELIVVKALLGVGGAGRLLSSKYCVAPLHKAHAICLPLCKRYKLTEEACCKGCRSDTEGPFWKTQLLQLKPQNAYGPYMMAISLSISLSTYIIYMYIHIHTHTHAHRCPAWG